jgi:hypothetical protein
MPSAVSEKYNTSIFTIYLPPASDVFLLLSLFFGAGGSVVGSSTMLQAERSRIRFPMTP